MQDYKKKQNVGSQFFVTLTILLIVIIFMIVKINSIQTSKLSEDVQTKEQEDFLYVDENNEASDKQIFDAKKDSYLLFGRNGYDITGYDVQVNVTKKNVYQIKETIRVYFSEQKHGLVREIPLKNSLSRADGSREVVRARVKNVTCNETFSKSANNGRFQMKIGDKDRTITGEKTYVIQYDYVMGNDKMENADEFYLNLIGSDWDVPIQNVSFSVFMPETIKDDSFGIYYGNYGETLGDGIQYQYEDKSLMGVLKDVVIMPGQAVTIRMELPEGYFEKQSFFFSGDELNANALVSILLATFLMVISAMLWYLYGNDDPVVETIHFHPPKGLNSLEVALAYHGSVVSDDVISLLIYLAHKGYIRITTVEGHLFSIGNDFTVSKVRDYDGNNKLERMFMEGLFRKGDIVTKKDLKTDFYKTCNKIVKSVNSKQNIEILFGDSLKMKWILYALAMFAFVLAVGTPLNMGAGGYLYACFVSCIYGVMLMVIINFMISRERTIANKIYVVFFCFSFFISFIMMVWEGLMMLDVIDWFATIYGLISFAVVLFFGYFMPKRTDYGTEVLGHLKGFKRFLETARKDELEALVEEQPDYFYEILPYTYVLGVSKKWMKQFESITIQPPNWYHSHFHNGFSAMAFGTQLQHTMASAKTTMSSSGSSGRHGGGHSGGGAGGGGGHSW